MSKSDGKETLEQRKARVIEEVLSSMSDDGLTLNKACAKAGIARSAFRNWRKDDKELEARYARARLNLFEYWADDMIDIADEPVPSTQNGGTDSGAVQKQRVQIDTRKWLLSKLVRDVYGDKIEVSGDPEKPLFNKIERIIVGDN